MFDRRRKRHIFAAIREYVWPSAGWRRALAYMRHRIARIPGTSYAIAAGFACGAAVSFTPFIGLHFLLAAFLAWIIGGNILTSAMGTVIGNPWTFPFIWIAIYNIGSWLLGIPKTDDLLGQIYVTLDAHSLMDIIKSPLDVLGPFLHTILLPMFIGGLILGSIVWIILFWILEKLVREYKHKKHLRHMAAAKKRRLKSEERARSVS
ncbi:MAG: DUF2062 domain-containing protein [Emcibacter sp.]|nr:DUF2062 domain-containing protein [Emcibacter sp.]